MLAKVVPFCLQFTQSCVLTQKMIIVQDPELQPLPLTTEL